MAARLRGHYPDRVERIQLNFRVPVETKRKVLASALLSGRTVQAEAAALLEIGLARTREVISA